MFRYLSFVLLATMCISALPAKAGTTNLQNMQAAYNGESNAHNRYLAFAKQADLEGYGEVASLFRAASRSEQIHASNHAVVIKSLGAVPQAQLVAPDVRSTRENLQAAIKGETYERDTMYPSFLKQARAEGKRDAIRSLNLARLAEVEHAKLYTRALQNLANLKGSQSKVFFVCPVCGFTTPDLNFASCPSCFTGKERFERVS